MRTRQAVAIGVALVAALGAVWYIVLAPSRGSFVAPGSSQLALTATQTGTGTWVRYLVTVKNLGDTPYSGDVVLINRTETSANPGTSVLPGVRPLPGAAGPIGTATVPAVAPDSAYQVRLELPSRHEVTVSVFAPPDYAAVEARDGSDQPVAGVQVDRTNSLPVAVLSDTETAADQLTGVTLGDVPLTVFNFQHGRGFPNEATLLAAYTTIVVDQFNSGLLTRGQQQALRDFVGLGGSLVIAAGTSWRQTVLPLPVDLTPVRPTATGTASMAEVGALSGRSFDLQAPVARGVVATGARTVLGEASAPLIAELDYGAGQVLQLAYDPAASPIAGTRLATDGWAQAIGRGLEMQPGSPPETRTVLGPESLPLELFPPAVDSPLPSPWLVGPLLLGYLLVVGPVNYLVLRQRLHRPALVWISTPLIAILFCSSFFVIGGRLQGTLRDDEVQLLKVAPQGTISSFEYNQVLFPSRGDHRLELPAATLVAPMTLQTYQDLAGSCQRCLVQLAGVQVGEEHVVAGAKPAVTERGVAYGSVRIVGAASIQHRPFGVTAHLAMTGGHLQGTVRNDSPTVLRGLGIYGYDSVAYHRTPLPDLPPGVTVSVDAVPDSVGASTIPAGVQPSLAARNEIIENAIAVAALAQSRQAVLVGFTELAPGRLLVDGANPPRAGLAAFEQPLLLEGADSMLADWARVRMAGLSGDARTGFLNLYDLELPRATGPFDIAYDSRQYSSLEIFDWGSGSWRPAAAGGTATGVRVTVRVAAGAIRDGLVRLRVKETRINWGSGLAFPG